MSRPRTLMAQYRAIKDQYRDCILLFRVGDFYETFYDDAVEVSRILNIALTSRERNRPDPIPLAGVPVHAAESYISRLLDAGCRVAVCEQVEDAASAKGLVRREVVEVLTPGTAMRSSLLSNPENVYLMAILPDGDRARYALALADVSTGEIFAGAAGVDGLEALVQGKRVRELVVPESLDRRPLRLFLETVGAPAVHEAPDAAFSPDALERAWREQYGEAAPALDDPERRACAALLAHVHALRGGRVPHMLEPRRLDAPAVLGLDPETIGNLELFEPQRGNDRRATLVHAIDRTVTPMGRRMLRRWLEQPLADVEGIEQRQEAVDCLYRDPVRHEAVLSALRGVADLQRLAARIAMRKAIPRELHALRESLERVPDVRLALAGSGVRFLDRELDALGDPHELADAIGRAIVDDPPGHLREGGVIRRGWDPELDTLIAASEQARAWIVGLEQRERDATGIPTLKVGFNKVFGYYIEVSNAHRERVPDRYVPRQTLVNAQRYITEELKAKEDLILRTQEQRVAAEQRAFDALCARVADALPSLQQTAEAIARIDVVQGLARVAREHGYRRPVVDASGDIEIVAGRHPVLERFVDDGFVPNDLRLDPQRRQVGLITGPNMSGKSTFLRQTALIVILAQMGAFVPADRARIGIVDQVFTRVGASDRLSRGESTFLVEMNETANILRNMTDRSLVLLDEIGRGTSTFDGLSLAWAVTEYILEGVRARPRTLFATHFHELTQLRRRYPRLVNLRVEIREWEGGIVFLRKVEPGVSDRSFGIHAARVAGLPAEVLARAEEILATLEARRSLLAQGMGLREDGAQLGLFAPPVPGGRAAEGDTAAGEPAGRGSPGGTEVPRAPAASTAPEGRLRDAIRDFDIERATPLEAFDLVRRLKADLDADHA